MWKNLALGYNFIKSYFKQKILKTTGYKSPKYNTEVGMGARYWREMIHVTWVVVRT